jgi:hypothetical protein
MNGMNIFDHSDIELIGIQNGFLFLGLTRYTRR